MTPSQEILASAHRHTRVLQVDASKIGEFVFHDPQLSFLGDWDLRLSKDSSDAANLQEAVSLLRESDVPVAFPTETVYGLGADATRSSAVLGIFDAKQRPSDNPLIVHISSISQLSDFFSFDGHADRPGRPGSDPIPKIYRSLIARFWPGPLTILLPLPTPSPFAAEVTTSLPTAAVRMPSSKLALALIQLAGTPLAAPSANASSKPSPTTAAHVLQDLSGRIDLILDGGPCAVGVESTVVDGLTDPPTILRPGGVSMEMLKEIPGWEDVTIGYDNRAEADLPRAPGMKYKHYSPNARVMLFHGEMNAKIARKHLKNARSLGLLTTRNWEAKNLHVPCQDPGDISVVASSTNRTHGIDEYEETIISARGIAPSFEESIFTSIPPARCSELQRCSDAEDPVEVWTVELGQDTVDIARGLFAALRELDRKQVEVIFVEGIDDRAGGARAAIMNRLRKAAEIEIRL